MQADQPLVLDGWFYENGGGTCFMLAWKIDDGDWEIVPDSAFTLSNQIQTTTTTTLPATTTTQSPSTTASVPTTNLQESSPPKVVQTTVADPVLIPETTAVTVPAVTVPDLIPEPTAPVTMPAATVPAATVPEPLPTEMPTTTLLLPTTTQPLQEPTSEPQSETDTQILQLISNLDESTPEEIVAAVATILDAGIDTEQATELATNPEVLATVTAEQAAEIFDAVDITSIDAADAVLLVAAVQDAPIEVRESFEEQINIFDGAIDSYVPIGSAVPISTRRAVIAVGALLSAAAVPTGRRN
jgi:hypothetical protein